MPQEGPNAEQIEYWNGPAGGNWVTYQERMDATLRPLGIEAMRRTGLAAGERVLDVGCGCGDTSFELARRVGPEGDVVGIDISTTMLDHARFRAGEQPDLKVGFENADAETHAFPAASRDVVFSRFGVMFFHNPARAFANLRTALVSGGRLAFACWRPLKENQWFALPLQIAAGIIELPEPTPPGEPGPFAFSDPDHVRSLLAEAGFTDIAVEPHGEKLPLGGNGTPEDVGAFVVQQGPLARALVLAEADDATKARVADAVRKAVEPYHDGEAVRLDSAIWAVTAQTS